MGAQQQVTRTPNRKTAEEAQGSGPGKDPEPERRRREAVAVNIRDMGSELERHPTRNPEPPEPRTRACDTE